MEENLLKIPRRARFSHVLRNKNFLFLWLDQLMSQLADRFLLYVLLILAYRLTKSNLGVSLPMLAFGVSAVLFGPTAGVFVDRWNKKFVMIFSNILRGLLIFLIIPFINQSLAIVFMISFIIFSVSQFFAPAETSSIPILVEKRDLIAANSLFMMTLMAASIIGIGMAAPLTNFFGIKIVLMIAASLHLFSTLATFMISLKHREKRTRVSLMNLFKELLMGLEFIRRKSLIQYSLIKLFFATSVLAAVCMLAIGFSEKILRIGAANFGYLIFSAGTGMVFGSLFLGRFAHRFKKGRLVFIGFLLGGVSLLLLSQIKNIWAVFTLIFFLGLGNAFIIAPLQTILHEKVPRVIRGRVFGVQNMFINSAFTFPVVILGEVADLIGLRVIMLLLGALVLISGIFDMFVSRFQEA
ncbi:MAG: MFS transporter [Candidatus Margulisiibacteriota bacterium]